MSMRRCWRQIGTAAIQIGRTASDEMTEGQRTPQRNTAFRSQQSRTPSVKGYTHGAKLSVAATQIEEAEGGEDAVLIEGQMGHRQALGAGLCSIRVFNPT